MTKNALLLSLASLLFSFPLLAQEGHKHTEPLEKIGKVSFPITWDQSVQKEFERGLALLHSFWYEEAGGVRESLSTDPNRFNGLYGAARSAELLQQPRTAAAYYAQLLKNCEDPSQRLELSHSKELLARN